MARATTTPRARPRFRLSIWTIAAPLALVVCVVVIASIARSAGWLGHGHAAKPAKVVRANRSAASPGSTVAMLYRPRPGDTLTDIAVRFGLSLASLHTLNPKASTSAALPASPRIRLR
jgi:LysM repeat protein